MHHRLRRIWAHCQYRSNLRPGSGRELPDYLPARMVNEFVYCPRLFFYEWVEGLFQESADTVEGAIQHKRVDEKPTALPAPGKLPETIHARSVRSRASACA